MRIVLVDTNERLVQNWRNLMGNVSTARHSVLVIKGRLSILSGSQINKPAAVVSPGNSFGYLGGGFDLALREYFGGTKFEQYFREQLGDTYRTVGSTKVVPLNSWGRDGFEYIVYVPTVVAPSRPLFDAERPRETGFEPVFNAMWNALIHVPAGTQTLVIPGLCSGYAGVPLDISSKSMCFALRLYLIKNTISKDLQRVLILQFLGYNYAPFMDNDWEEECEAVGIDVRKLMKFDVANDSINEIMPII